MLYLIENIGFVFLLLAAAGIATCIAIAKGRARREKWEEIRKMQENAAKARGKQEAAARAAAEKERAERARKAETERRKAEQATALEAARAEKFAAREAARKAADERRAEKLEAARLLAEYRERAFAAARELKALDVALKASAPVQAPEQRPETISTAAPDPVRPSAPETAPDNAPKPFAGQIVSFTGKLRSMTRAQAAEIVRKGGGKAFTKAMPAGTTLLVVGDIAGDGNTGKLDKADEWIGQVKKIYEPQFMAMLAG